MSPKKYRARTGDIARAVARHTIAKEYFQLADREAAADRPFAHNAAAGNAVLAAIAASDAICCVRLQLYSTGEDHIAAVDLLKKAQPEGPEAARALARVLSVKDQVHYSGDPLSATRMQGVLRCARRLVEIAGEVLTQAQR